MNNENHFFGIQTTNSRSNDQKPGEDNSTADYPMHWNPLSQDTQNCKGECVKSKGEMQTFRKILEATKA